MKITLFYHSLVSDWNHGNAHFLRGYAAELIARGHDVRIFEPENGWSARNLAEEAGEEALRGYTAAYPALVSRTYDPATADAAELIDGSDVAIAHEWNDPAFIARLGQHRARVPSFRLLFHDTHHRAVTAPDEMSRYDLTHFDGVLAYGAALRDVYLRNGWAERVWVWHEAADTRVFRPAPAASREGDLVWIGNWGDGERSSEIREFLIEPARRLGLKTRVYGVRYPESAQRELAEAGVEYAGWLPNHAVPEVFGRFRMTVHIPRRPYVEALPGIPTIRVFEALACGIPLVCAPWEDSERLFEPGCDFLIAKDGAEMTERLAALRDDPAAAQALIDSGLRAIEGRHSCSHRVDELLAICRLLESESAPRTRHA